MKNADIPAMPMADRMIPEEGASIEVVGYYGLTKREHFAAMAMQGLIASDTPEWVGTPESQAENAVKYADELLKELDK